MYDANRSVHTFSKESVTYDIEWDASKTVPLANEATGSVEIAVPSDRVDSPVSVRIGSKTFEFANPAVFGDVSWRVEPETAAERLQIVSVEDFEGGRVVLSDGSVFLNPLGVGPSSTRLGQRPDKVPVPQSFIQNGVVRTGTPERTRLFGRGNETVVVESASSIEVNGESFAVADLQTPSAPPLKAAVVSTVVGGTVTLSNGATFTNPVKDLEHDMWFQTTAFGKAVWFPNRRQAEVVMSVGHTESHPAEFMEFDLKTDQFVHGVTTKGGGTWYSSEAMWVTKYRVAFKSHRDDDFSVAQSVSGVSEMVGNSNRDGSVTNLIKDASTQQPPLARYIRIYPLDWAGAICMRAGLMISPPGVPFVVQTPEPAPSVIDEYVISAVNEKVGAPVQLSSERFGNPSFRNIKVQEPKRMAMEYVDANMHKMFADKFVYMDMPAPDTRKEPEKPPSWKLTSTRLPVTTTTLMIFVFATCCVVIPGFGFVAWILGMTRGRYTLRDRTFH